MNSFEEYTVVIGVLAILIEGVRGMKEFFKSWHFRFNIGAILPLYSLFYNNFIKRALFLSHRL